MGLHDYTFYDLISRNAVAYRNLSAWFEVDDQRSLTFAAYKQKVDQLACGLQNAGIKKGDCIGVLGQNSLEYFLLYGAAAALGGIVLPINWRLSAEEAIFNLNDGEPVLLFVDPDYQEMIGGVKDQLATVKEYYNLKPPGGNFSNFDALIENDGKFTAPDVATGDGLVIIHTAAVAGRPRGALLSHGNLISANIHLNLLMNLSPVGVHLNILPLFHVGGLFMATGAFHGGALNINMSKFDAARAVDLIEEKQVSVMFDFAPILGSVLEAAEKSGKDIRTLQHVIGLESPEVIEKYQESVGGTFYCMYGQTETSAIATMGRYSDKPGSAGRTLRGGWQHTGDLGRFDEDGYLWYEGRKAEKELIKPGGENVYPAEVEKVILEHPDVDKAVVFGVPDPKWKEGIKAVCQLRKGASLEARALIQFVGARIASFKKPQYVEFVSEIPLLEDGPPDRARVKELYGGPQD
jgi:long-chain acyl-CoA synthetase